ncbi:hypothetical protein [Arthrobacter agilis]|uniref:hypothetical protein n=1 Tax=Arthrobacter agilis TaxID=37921 RepID=UPI00277E2419|nr:hypothetical protein [Arthrobacter agilis]MDQ0736036.1 hypothetical protein [Arthrobacter agilis]
MAGVSVALLLAAGSAVLMLSSGRAPGSNRAAEGGVEGQGLRDAPLMLDLLGAMVAAGASVESALSVVADACEPGVGAALERVCAARLLGASWESAWESVSEPVSEPMSTSGGVQAGGSPGSPAGGAWSGHRRRRPGEVLFVPRRGSGGALHVPRRGRAGHSPAQTVAAIREGLRFATTTGAPSAALLHAHAAQLRRRRNREIDRMAAALGVRLVLPLGLCSLPAFICLGVIPVVLGLLPVF